MFPQQVASGHLEVTRGHLVAWSPDAHIFTESPSNKGFLFLNLKCPSTKASQPESAPPPLFSLLFFTHPPKPSHVGASFVALAFPLAPLIS